MLWVSQGRMDGDKVGMEKGRVKPVTKVFCFCFL